MASTPIMSAEEYNSLPHFDNVVARNTEDDECLREIRDVLKRHGRLNRFGVMLLHKHFDLAPGEMLVEYTNEKDRSQSVEVVSEKEMPPCGVETAWVLSEGQAMMKCYPGVCTYYNGEHHRSHVSYPDVAG